jgi:hypothetical protein
MLPLLWILGAALIGAAIYVTWASITGWMRSQQVYTTDYGTMIRQRLADGKVRVVANVFDANGSLRAATSQEGIEDQELAQVFGFRNEIKVTL